MGESAFGHLEKVGFGAERFLICTSYRHPFVTQIREHFNRAFAEGIMCRIFYQCFPLAKTKCRTCAVPALACGRSQPTPIGVLLPI